MSSIAITKKSQITFKHSSGLMAVLQHDGNIWFEFATTDGQVKGGLLDASGAHIVHALFSMVVEHLPAKEEP